MRFMLMVVLAQVAAPAPAESPFEINTVLMQSTFHLQGPSRVAGEIAVGSGFVIGRPCDDASAGKAAFTLVTAAHVLEQISGENMLVLMRARQSDGTWRRVEHRVRIREGSRDLWTRHPDADVAAFYVALPEGVVEDLLPTSMLATDDVLTRFAVHPGDEVFALGFPHGVEANESGFPLLRSGRISSYPLLPQSRTRTFRVDMDAFPGNSGGPVYFWDRNRFYDGSIQIGEVRFLMGIVTGTVFGRDAAGTRLRIAEVVHANFVLETVSGLPAPNCLGGA